MTPPVQMGGVNNIIILCDLGMRFKLVDIDKPFLLRGGMEFSPSPMYLGGKAVSILGWKVVLVFRGDV